VLSFSTKRNSVTQQGLEGWVSEKITLANDYLKTVREYLEYELMTGGAETTQAEEMINMEDASAGGVSAGAIATSPAALMKKIVKRK
jgi:hypothetical protein